MSAPHNLCTQGSFENRSTWWDPTAASSPTAATAHLSRLVSHAQAGEHDRSHLAPTTTTTAFLDADFRTASFSLVMMEQSNDMHLAFHSREAKVGL